jgi:hypothetical protein
MFARRGHDFEEHSPSRALRVKVGRPSIARRSTTVMTEQFPDDIRNGRGRAVFHLLSVTLDPHRRSEFADRAPALLEDVVSGAVILITAWQRRHMRAKADWNQQVQALPAGYDEAGAEYIDDMWCGGIATRARMALV